MPMTPLQRKVALMEKGVTFTEIAKQQGVTVQHVSHVNRGVRRSPSIEKAIADAIGKPIGRVFEAA